MYFYGLLNVTDVSTFHFFDFYIKYHFQFLENHTHTHKIHTRHNYKKHATGTVQLLVLPMSRNVLVGIDLILSCFGSVGHLPEVLVSKV